MRIIYFVISFFICFFLFQTNLIQIKEKPPKTLKIDKIYEEKALTDDSKTIKEILIKALDSHIKEENFINKHFINKTLDQVSKQLAIYYNQIVNIKDDPDKSIKILNDIINNSQAYIEAGAMYLGQLLNDLTKDYNQIKDKYCTGYFERLFNSHAWKEKISLDEIEKINELESQMQEITNFLNIFNRTKILFKIIDWTTNSNSPFAWIVRKFMKL